MAEVLECIICGEILGHVGRFCSDACDREYHHINRKCEDCGGEFWDGGTSCTCGEQDFKRAMDALEQHEKEIHDHNAELLQSTNITGWDIKELMDGASITGKMEIVSQPTGSDNRETVGIFKNVWVDQYSVGTEGDSWAGHIYGEFSNGQWLKIPYEC